MAFFSAEAGLSRWPSAKLDAEHVCLHTVFQSVVPQDACRRQKPSEVRAAASTQVYTKERRVLEAALKKAKSQTEVPPVEDLSVKRAKKLLALADTKLQAAVKKKSQCEQEIAEAEADLARMREEHSASDEEPKTEVQQLQMPSWKRSGTATFEVPKKLQ